MGDGLNVVLTGGRYEPDVLIPKALGAIIIRIDADPSVRSHRILQRDGVIPTEEQLCHSGEVALDDWDGYDIRIDNNGSVQEAISEIQERLSCLL